MIIRSVQLADAKAIRAIYQPYVTETAITFEVDVPTVQEFERRITKTLAQFPYLVAVVEGKVVGYAYASTYYARAAYDWTVELSIYVAKEMRGKGVGSALYEALEEELKARGYLRFLSCIAVPNEASISMHKKRGYVQVAHFPKIGFKFNQWHDIVWMQKTIQGPVTTLKDQ